MESDVLASARKQILFLPHAIQQMSRADRMITTTDVKEVIFCGKIMSCMKMTREEEAVLCFTCRMEGRYM